MERLPFSVSTLFIMSFRFAYIIMMLSIGYMASAHSTYRPDSLYSGTQAEVYDSITAVASGEIISLDSLAPIPVDVVTLEQVTIDSAALMPQLPATFTPEASLTLRPEVNKSIYCHPYSMTYSCGDWKRMWTNTAVLSGAFVGTLLVLECLPPDATAWNRAEIRNVPLFRRWYNHVIKAGPEWDHDNPIFNYILHPYAGAAYFMSARSTGFNFWQSMLYSASISTIGWEFGIEAFMERPSIQDLFITPGIGSLIGEGFYRIKRSIVANDYTLAGSRFLGNIVVFLVDPVNEVVDLFRGRNTNCSSGVEISSSFSPNSFSLAITF